MEELPQGYENTGVTPKGDRVLGADGQEWGGGINYPDTQDTKASEFSSSDEEMASGLGLAAPQLS